jgi:uncharacterized protein with FMN-binding domain
MVNTTRRNALWLASTAAAVALLFGYHTSTSEALPATTGTVATASATPGTTTGSTTGTGSASGTTSGSTSAGTTFTGTVAQTRWGPVQVEITVADGKITDVAVPQYPSGNGKDQQINSYALPELKQETLSAQSANIDVVSGATVTSDGYVESLQSALDRAGL